MECSKAQDLGAVESGARSMVAARLGVAGEVGEQGRVCLAEHQHARALQRNNESEKNGWRGAQGRER